MKKLGMIFLILFSFCFYAKAYELTTQEQLNRSLIGATTWGDFDAVKSLLEHGADVNYRSFQGWTALMFAVIYVHPNTVELLLAKGADPTLTNIWGTSALMLVDQMKSSEESSYYYYTRKVDWVDGVESFYRKTFKHFDRERIRNMLIGAGA